MAELAQRYSDATDDLTNRSWQVFDGVIQKGGAVSPSEFEDFGFNSQQAMRPHVKALEDAQLVVASIDETDQRRRTISVTARGWIVQYKRSGFKPVQRT